MFRRALVSLVGAPVLARAQPRPRAPEWPQRVVRMVVPFAAGGPLDVPARMIAEPLGRLIGATIVIDNRPGAGGTIGLASVAQSAPDGGTITFTSAALAVAPALHPTLSFDPIRDFAPLTLVAEIAGSLSIPANSRFQDIAALVAAAKAEPGRLTYGSSGIGSANHLAAGLFEHAAGVQMTHVPYRGVSPSLIALQAGDIDMVFASTIEVVPHHRAGRLRMLGVTTARRAPDLDDIPAIGETVAGYEAPNWYAMLAPAATPAPLLQRLHRAIAALREDAALLARMREVGSPPLLDGPQPLAARLAEEVPKWRRVVAEANIRAD